LWYIYVDNNTTLKMKYEVIVSLHFYTSQIHYLYVSYGNNSNIYITVQLPCFQYISYGNNSKCFFFFEVPSFGMKILVGIYISFYSNNFWWQFAFNLGNAYTSAWLRLGNFAWLWLGNFFLHWIFRFQKYFEQKVQGFVFFFFISKLYNL